jgi:hypothetical protein
MTSLTKRETQDDKSVSGTRPRSRSSRHAHENQPTHPIIPFLASKSRPSALTYPPYDHRLDDELQGPRVELEQADEVERRDQYREEMFYCP